MDNIATGTFPNDFKGSPLEIVLTAITEQKQVFEGAAHPFYWKPKLRIPDIYENQVNKQKFGAFLQACLTATRDDQVLTDMGRRYLRADYIGLCKRIERDLPHVTLTTDIMVGFPTESESCFQSTLDLASEVGFLKAHVFRFSPRGGCERSDGRAGCFQ